MRGLPVKAKPIETPRPVVNLMDALKRSLAQETGEPMKASKRKAVADRTQRSLLLPLTGKGRERQPPVASRSNRRRKA